MEYIYGVLVGQFIYAAINLVSDIRDIAKTRVYRGSQLIITVSCFIPFMPFFLIAHVLMDKLEKKILPKMWILPPKSQQM